MENKHKRRIIPISFKMITIISLIVIVSFTAMTYLSSTMFLNDTKVRSEENTLEKADLVALTAAANFRSILEKSKLAIMAVREGRVSPSVSLALNTDQEESDAEIFSSLLFQKDPDMISISIISKDKDSYKETKSLKNTDFLDGIGADENLFEKIIISEKDSIDKAAAGADTVINVSPYFRKPVIAIAAPYDRKSSDIIFITFSMNLLLDAVKSPNIVKSYIVNGNGDIIAHYDTKLVEQKANQMNLPIVAKMLKSSSDNEKIEYKDEKGLAHLGSFKKVGFSDIAVISSVQQKTAFKAAYRIRYQTILIALIVLNLAIVLIYFFSKTLTRPIKKLVDVTREIEKGNFNVSIHTKSRDEIALLADSVSDMATGLAEREKMKDAFGKFVNKEIAEMVLKNELKLGGERKNAAVFFSDIRSFTAISENLEPEEVVEFLNEYMTLMVDCVNKTNGVVDKFIGDAIMAIWGTPISHGNDTENAINAALMMRESLMEFNKGRGSAKKPIIKIGCGINTGPVLAGQIGSHERMEYTVIGDTVNLASRVETLNKPFGTDILVSSDAYQITKNMFIFEPMEKIKVKGKKDAQQIYAVINKKDAKTGPKNITELRSLLGISLKDVKKIDQDYTEDKYEIIK